MIEGIKYILILCVITLIFYLNVNCKNCKESFNDDCKRKPGKEEHSASHEFLIKQMDITKGIFDFDPGCMTEKKAGKFPDVKDCVIL
jgi:hypothetical protein